MLLACAAPAIAQQAVTSTSGATLIKNATILTVTKGTLENTDLLMQNGKIAQIGKNLAAPAGARTIDATGKFILPGIIDPHSHMMADGINEGSLSVTSMVRIRDVLNPTAINIYRALAGGVTTINVLHGSANTIGGQNATVKLKYGRPVEDMLFKGAPPGIVMILAAFWGLVPGALSFIRFSEAATGGPVTFDALQDTGAAVFAIALGTLIGWTVFRTYAVARGRP